MSYRVGLVGKPSVGKSTFFNAATNNDVPEGAYPFTTIDPAVGEAYVRVECAAPEFGEECTPATGFCEDGTRFVPTKLVDVAGLIPGAHEGAGLGNQFLTDLNEADVLIHVVDFSGTTDIEGEATEGHDPREDIDFLETELDQWYLDVLEKGIERYEGQHMADATLEVELAEQMSAFRTSPEEVKQVLLALDLAFDPDTWDDADRLELAREMRTRTKPMVVAANKMDTPEAQANWAAITDDDEYDHLEFVPVSAHAEQALTQADQGGVVDYRSGDDAFTIVGEPSDDQRAGLESIREFVTEYAGTGVQSAIEAALFDALGVKPVFPGSANGLGTADGRVLPDVFLLEPDATAEDFAYAVHSDVGDGFLHAVDCRANRQIAADQDLDSRAVIEIISTN
ncbi:MULTISPECIES: redox-regulated ATPase YchF [Halobacterium]|uniref:redox-regulated ATPase YchF n=1 Tax=Halobacterium TaxID=2239 RepID=UPI001962E9DC|nr:MULTISPECIES: redox-regulated ATPase YchF [Halobacterium]MCF2164795.1 redox-regulated ATPase YchF [Halobacterium salinarum]MCF2168580.1 redox-regulated ATPase YchF [Halobacterium salinarum]MCF2239241.1 redox-regulated ATPase YchF [Halobacterium salinarum]QRY22037.1 redox-regulated ATPase YchF [Halobacterium sp. GSL-19]